MVITPERASMKLKNNPKILSNLIWLSVLALGLGYFLSYGKVVSDISQFMPQSSTQLQLNILLNEIQKGAASRYILVRVEADSAMRSAQLSQELKQHLIQNPLFASVKNGEQDFALDMFQKIYPYRFLLSDPGSFTTEVLQQDLQARLIELRSGMGVILKQTLTSDPQNIFINYLWQLSSRGQPEKHLGVWFDHNHRGAMLLVALASGGYDLNQQEQAINSIKNYISNLPQASPVKLEMSGPAVMAVATRASIQSTMFYLSCIAGGLMFVLFLWGYRSVKRFFIAGLPLASAILIALVATNIVFDQVHGIVIAFGITLLGVCLDFPLHLFSHLNRGETPVQTLASIWPTLRLSVVTTALSYLALFGTDFAGLSQLAVFAMAGLLTALLVTRWVVPLWLVGTENDLQVRPLSLYCTRPYKYSIVFAGIVLPLVILLLNAEHLWSKDIASLSPIPVAARQLDKKLRTQMSAPDVQHSFFIASDDPETLLQKVEAISQEIKTAQQQGLVQQVFSVSDILPSQKQQRQRQAQLPEAQRLSSALTAALVDMPYSKTAFNEFLRDVEKTKHLPGLSWQDMQSTPLADTLNQDLFQLNGRWLSMIRVSGIIDEPRFLQWLATKPELHKHYLNMRQASSELMHEYQQTALARLGIGIAIIAVLVLFMTRSLKRMLRLILPILLAVLITLSLQVLMGVALTLFHILALLLVVGMGLDYSLFFNRPLNAGEDLKRRTHGVMMSAGSTLAAFGVMSFTAIPVLAAMGQTVSIGVLCCYVLAQLLAEPRRAE